MRKETEDEKITRIANMIDPDGTFLNECEKIVKERFKGDYVYLQIEEITHN